ncbi:MAG: hypothetical protein LC723_14855 [Actinobacteria bacterium]|nr:hypothetical protein [Actinomycetota bacterium]
MPRLFGTDGIRGVANIDLTPEFAFKLGRATAVEMGGSKKHPCRISRDRAWGRGWCSHLFFAQPGSR